MTSTSIYGVTNDIVYGATNDTAHLNTAEPQPQSINSIGKAAGASLPPAIHGAIDCVVRGAINIEELKTLSARSRQRVMTAIAEYREEEAEYKQLFHTERWWEKVPGFDLLAGISRGLLYRLFVRSKNGLNYWLLQHEGMNGSRKIRDSKLEHEYVVNLAAAALGQGFDEGQDRRFPQTEKLIRAWWKLHDIQPQQPEMELLVVIGDALRRAKDRHRYTPNVLAARKGKEAERLRKFRKRQAEAEGRVYKTRPNFKLGETANRVAGWLVEKARLENEPTKDLFRLIERESRVGWSVKEAAEQLGLPRETARKCLSRLAANYPEQVAKVERGLYRFVGDTDNVH